MPIAAAILLVLLIILAAVGYMMAGYSMRIRPQTLEEARAWQEAHYDLSWYDALAKEDYTVTSFDGYILHAQWVKNPQPVHKYILISHGYTDNRFGALKYARIYLDAGFHVIIYDLRGHGMNDPAFCTYSIRESRDLDTMIRDCRARHPDCEILGLHGESLGAATSVACLKYHPPVDFVIADCPFSEIISVLRGGMKSMHMPAFLLGSASLCAKLRFGYSYSEMRPIDSLADNSVPLLCIHGAEDSFIPPEHSKALCEATQGYSELCLIAGANHAVSVLTDPAAYRQAVMRFLFGGRH